MHLETLIPSLVLAILLKLVSSIHVGSDDEPGINYTELDFIDNSDVIRNSDVSNKTSFYSFKATDIDGMPHNLSQHAGKVSLIVNVASQCGYTDTHYKQLVQLHSDMSADGHFTVLAFPCNQFGQQEPWSDKKIKAFTRKQYQVNFPLFSKIDVQGSNVPSYWHHIMDQSGHRPTWNFWKYLVNGQGDVLHAWGPWVSVNSIRPIVHQAVLQASRLTQPEL